MKTITKRVLARIAPLCIFFIIVNILLWLKFLIGKDPEIHINMIMMPIFSLFLLIIMSLSAIRMEKIKLMIEEMPKCCGIMIMCISVEPKENNDDDKPEEITS